MQVVKFSSKYPSSAALHRAGSLLGSALDRPASLDSVQGRVQSNFGDLLVEQVGKIGFDPAHEEPVRLGLEELDRAPVMMVPFLTPGIGQLLVGRNAEMALVARRVSPLATAQTASDPVLPVARVQDEDRVGILSSQIRKELVGLEMIEVVQILHVGEHVEIRISGKQIIAVCEIGEDAPGQSTVIPVDAAKAVRSQIAMDGAGAAAT